MHNPRARFGILLSVALLGAMLASGMGAAGAGPGQSGSSAAAEHWTPARRAAAIPRDLVVDERGLGYLRGKDGSLTPYGHSVAAERAGVQAAPAANGSSPSPQAKPGGGGSSDTTPPTISAMDPASNAAIGAAYTFSATVVDTGSGVRSVSFVIVYPSGSTQTFSASPSGGDTWSVSFTGFTDGSWAWRVVARDHGAKGGNTATSPTVPFTVSTSGGGGGGGGVVTSSPWSFGGAVQTAAGRVYFEMPANSRQTRWTGYVCSGTVATDSITGRSIIITAAHCVYDDVNKAFARNVLFIPDQAGTTGTGTDLNCTNDPLGCWAPTAGVVDSDWATRTFPDNIEWDYAYYVVPDSGAHSGTSVPSEALDASAGSMDVQFSAAPTVGNVTHALGYSYSEDPKLMYCAEAMGTEGTVNWWLPSCLLTGGASGGPWVQPMDTGTGSGPIISVNSWGYTNSAGMAGPKLSGSSASCLFDAAGITALTNPNRGVIPADC